MPMHVYLCAQPARLEKEMKLRTTYDGNQDITPGKVYETEVIGAFEGEICKAIVDDSGRLVLVHLVGPCPELGDVGFWEIVEE